MGKTFGMTATRKRPGLASQPLRALLVTLAALGAWTSAPHGFAQDNSPGSFTLPPGPQQDTSPPSNVQGPVDAESSPPRRTDEPAVPAPRPPVTTIAPTPVPRQATQRPRATPQPRAAVPGTTPGATPGTARPRPAPQVVRPQPTAPVATAPSVSAPATVTPPPVATPDVTPDPSATTPLPAPELPAPSVPDAAPEPELDPAEVEDQGSLWWWAAAGAIALISLIVMALRQRRPKAETRAAVATAPVVPTATVPTPPLRAQRPATAPQQMPPPTPSPSLAPSPAALAQAFQPQAQPRPQPAPVREFAPAAPPPPPAPPRQPPVSSADLEAQSQALASGILPDTALAAGPASTSAPVSTPKGKPVPHEFGEQDEPAQVPRLLLDFTTLGVDVTLVNAVARYHLGITNMADIAVSKLALHGAIIQARRGMPPTVDPMRGDALLPHLQKIADIEPGSTQRCEGQIRLPLNQIEPIEMQGRLLFVPVVHIWIGYDGPDGTRYAVTQSFVLGEESSPPGTRVGPLRLDLGPRRFTAIGQRPLQPA